MIETRKITLTCELPEVLCGVLEQEAARNGHSFEEEVIDYPGRSRPRRPRLSPEETEKLRGPFERSFGFWRSGDPDSSDNERIDADLAREYANDHEGQDDRMTFHNPATAPVRPTSPSPPPA